MMKFQRGDILWIRCDPSVGVEPKKTRTCVVVSNDDANERSATVTVVPTLRWTAKRSGRYYIVDLGAPRSSLTEHRVANCSTPQTYDRNRIVRHGGTVSRVAMDEISRALREYLELDEDALYAREREVEYRIAAAVRERLAAQPPTEKRRSARRERR